MADLLLELFSEEIPARMQAPASADLKRLLTGALNEAELKYDAVNTFVTPRRLAISITGIPALQADKTVERKGPKTNAPDKALEGFLRSTGLTKDQLEVRQVGKDEVYFANIEQKGRPTADILKEEIEKILLSFPWPKSMRWGSHDIRWVRPLHSILCLFDGMVVPVSFGPVKAGNITYGHRFLSPKPIPIRDPSEYVEKLKDANVFADAEERKQLIHIKAKELAASHGLTLKEDDGLLQEVTGLVEWPILLVGSIDDKYMELPPEVLISEMRAHQKYFALLGSRIEDRGASETTPLDPRPSPLAPKFIITANMETADRGDAIIAGNERVLRARFADGEFFWNQDRKKTLEEWAENLKSVTYHAKLGSMADKVERVKKLAKTAGISLRDPSAYRHRLGSSNISETSAAMAENFEENVQKAAALCKADLVTGMVDEFPELQGIMGGYYAKGEAEQVACAIRDHYKPAGPQDTVPTDPVTICIAVADKLDTLCGMFAIGDFPTGSKDPFALRRAAIGIINLLRKNERDFLLYDVARLHMHNNFINPHSDFDPGNDKKLKDFFLERLKVMLRDEGIRHDVIDCAYNADHEEFKQLNIYPLTCYIQELDKTLKSENGGQLTQLAKRVLNILAAEEKKDGASYGPLHEADGLKTDQAKRLFTATWEASAHVDKSLKNSDYPAVMTALLSLQTPLADFFDNVMVNDENPDIRQNRLKLLASLRAMLDKCGDFTQLEG